VAQRTQVPPPRLRLLFIGLPMAGGAGLVIHILAGFSLPLAIGVLVVAGGALWAWAWSRLSEPSRRYMRRRAAVGVVAGLVGVVAYDLARYGTVAAFSMSFQPFHVFTLFGEAFIGPGHSPMSTFAVGALYHVCNGTFFGLAYTLVIRRPSWWTGALWGMGLEVAMASLYPSWLRMEVLREFLEISILGHLVYGSVLGLAAAAGVRRMSLEEVR
jgi:hypothetical protein